MALYMGYIGLTKLEIMIKIIKTRVLFVQMNIS